MEYLRLVWSNSKWYRISLILALVWFVLRLTVQVIYASGMMPELAGDDGLPADLPVYLDAAKNFLSGQDLYPETFGESILYFHYSPLFAMLTTFLLWFPARGVAIVGTFLTVLAYGLLYIKWMQIFKQLSLPAVTEKMAYLLPVWLIFSAFWGLVTFLNVGVLITLIATLLIDNVLKERLGRAAFLAVLLLVSKVMWVFPLALPFLLGSRKFFFRLTGLVALMYTVLIGVGMIWSGPGYILEQYSQYLTHLQRLTVEYPWHTRDIIPFLGYNHSIKQIFIFVFGSAPWVFNLASLVKILILLPFAFLCWTLYRTAETPNTYLFKISLAFGLYLSTFIWLDMVWDVLLGIAIFPVILVIVQRKWQKALLWGLFLLYAFVDIIQFFSYIFGGEDIVVRGGAYVLTDPSLHLPLVMMVILSFYGIILRNLWQWLPNLTNSGQGKMG
jgi:hypothetical protein